MAILVTNQSHFKPMSFEEILKPYQIMTEEYNKREAEISALDTKAETMRQYADNEIRDNLQALGLEVNEANINQWIKDNPNSFATKYMNYASSLDKAAEDLATKGLRGTNRKTIYDLTNQYQTNIVPIETASKTKAALAEEQRKALLANPDLRFDIDFSTIGLQQLIDNPDLGYTPYNLKDFEERGALSGAGILSRMTESRTLDESEQWYTFTKGVSQNDLIRWQSGDTDVSHYDDTQSIAALNAAREEAQSIAATVPESLRDEVFNRVFEYSVNAMQQTTREKANMDYESPSQKRLAERDRQQFNIWLKENGYKKDAKGNIVEDEESLVYKLKEADRAAKIANAGLIYNEETGKYEIDENNPKWKTINGVKIVGGKIVDTNTGSIISMEELQSRRERIAGITQLIGTDLLYTEDSLEPLTSLWQGKFDKTNVAPISYAQLSEKGQDKVDKLLEKYHLELEDISIYRDSDWGTWGDDEFKITINKNSNFYKTYIENQSSRGTSAEGNRGKAPEAAASDSTAVGSAGIPSLSDPDSFGDPNK